MSKETVNQVRTRKLLILSTGQRGRDDHDLAVLGQLFDLTIAENLEQAQQLLDSQEFDAVLSETCDFRLIEQAVVSQQAISILQTIGEGVCIAGADGTIVWANEKMKEYLTVVRVGVSERCQQAFDLFLKGPPLTSSDRHSRRYSFTDESEDRYFEMLVTPMLDSAGSLIQVTAVVWEETASRRLQKRIDVIDKAGRELVRLEAESFGGLTVEQRINLLQTKIVRYARDLLRFDHFVVRVLHKKTRQLDVLFGVGLPGDEEKEVFANIDNNGITGYVAVTGRSYICNNPATDPRYLPGLDSAASSLTVPLRLHDKIIGTLNVESSEEGAFTEDDRQVAEIFGRYIAIALNILNLLVVERYQTTGQAVDNLNQQVCDPVSKIITEASMLMEEYIGHDDMRCRLQAIVDHAADIKRAVREAQNAPKGIVTSPLAPGKEADSALQGRRILVVDDEQFIRETIMDVVEKYGCEADMAADGRAALALIKQQFYDLVISDIKLPHATGYDIFAAAREIDRDIPVILMTGFGYDPNHSIVRANKEGLSAVLYKPFKVDQLMNEIRQAIGSSGSQG